MMNAPKSKKLFGELLEQLNNISKTATTFDLAMFAKQAMVQLGERAMDMEHELIIAENRCKSLEIYLAETETKLREAKKS